MVQDSIEDMLQQKLGLDASSVGSRMIARAVQQRQAACQISDRSAYLKHLQSSPDEFDQLIEAVVIPETWFFRDREPFEYLRTFVQQHLHPADQQDAPKLLRLLSVPCSTGEEPYSIAITLLEAGLTVEQFQIDAVDISQQALTLARRAVYRKKSFRGGKIPYLERYFQSTAEGCELSPTVRNCVHLIHGNLLEPRFLTGKQYHAIFCRNLLIYLDEAARRQVIDSLDQALAPQGVLFLGAVETPQMANRGYRAVPHPAAFAFQKGPFADVAAATPPRPAEARPSPPRDRPPTAANRVVPPSPPAPLHSVLTALETAKQLADRGELATAATLCEAYLRSHPSQAAAHLLLGEIYQGLNQSRQAEESFQRAVYLDPNAYEALIHLSLLKEQQGNWAESARFRRRAQRLVQRQHPQSQSGG